MSDSISLNDMYLEDFHSGDKFTSETYTVCEEAILEFAAKFDPQPFHLNQQAAEESIFHGLAASGWHTAAITMKLIVSCLNIANGLIGAGSELSWPHPTRPGDELSVEITVVDVKVSSSKPDRGIVTFDILTLNKAGVAVQKSRSKLLVFRRALHSQK